MNSIEQRQHIHTRNCNNIASGQAATKLQQDSQYEVEARQRRIDPLLIIFAMGFFSNKKCKFYPCLSRQQNHRAHIQTQNDPTVETTKNTHSSKCNRSFSSKQRATNLTRSARFLMNTITLFQSCELHSPIISIANAFVGSRTLFGACFFSRMLHVFVIVSGGSFCLSYIQMCL